jgi:hypothetical protein
MAQITGTLLQLLDVNMSKNIGEEKGIEMLFPVMKCGRFNLICLHIQCDT